MRPKALLQNFTNATKARQKHRKKRRVSAILEYFDAVFLQGFLKLFTALITGGCLVVGFSAYVKAASCPEIAWQEIAPSFYLARGIVSGVNAQNCGRTSNIAVWIREGQALWFGSGGNTKHAASLYAHLQKIQPFATTWVVNLQSTPNHVLGNDLLAQGAQVVAHRETHKYMTKNCAQCLMNAKRDGDPLHFEDTSPRLPDILFETTWQPPADSPFAGRIKVHASDHTFQKGSAWAHIPELGMLVVGELNSSAYIPEITNAHIATWITKLDELAQNYKGHTVVPSQGAVFPVEQGGLRDYLVALDEKVRASYQGLSSLLETLDEAALPTYKAWSGYAAHHSSNVQLHFLAVEMEDFN